MALAASILRRALLLLLSVGLSLSLGLLLPEALKLLVTFLGLPFDNTSHAIVLVYFVFMLFLVMPSDSLPRGTVPTQGKGVLITGCDSGFGLALAKHLHKLGFTIFAGCLLKDKNGEGAQELKSFHCHRMKVLQLNVCSEEEVKQAVEFVKKNLEDCDKGLWGLVNNAGISTFGEVEFTSIDTYKEIAEVNLWGTIRVTKAFIPLVRQGKGRVVCIASMLGRMGYPSRSSYCVSKYGIEAFSDCLRQEMYKWDVKVITIEPGNFVAATGIFTKEGVERRGQDMWEQASESVQADYGKTNFSHQVARMKAFVNSGSKDMTPVVNVITDALRSKYPYTRYNPMDTYCWIKLQIMTHLPAAIADCIYT